jgi:hypothetical protein
MESWLEELDLSPGLEMVVGAVRTFKFNIALSALVVSLYTE